MTPKEKDSLKEYLLAAYKLTSRMASAQRCIKKAMEIIEQADKIDDTPHSGDLLDQIMVIAHKHGSELPHGSVEINTGQGHSANLTFLDTGDTKKIDEEVRRILPKGTRINIELQHVHIVNTK